MVHPAQLTKEITMNKPLIYAVRFAAFQAFDEAVANNMELTIVCYINGAIRPWKHYPSMILA
jgi:hypothetical protein